MKANNRRTAPQSIHERLKAHMQATAEAREYATEGIALAQSGKMAAAKAAARKAEAARARMQELETSMAHTYQRPSDPS